MFPLWLDPPSAGPSPSPKPHWYDLIKTSAGQSFTTDQGNEINVNVGQGKGMIHLFADPAFQQTFDDRVRAHSGAAAARDSTGTLDACGWPGAKADAASKAQWHRRSEPFFDDFSNGLDPTKMVVALVKGCCDKEKYAQNPFYKNINIVLDDVDGSGRLRNVLQLTAHNHDNPDLCNGTTPTTPTTPTTQKGKCRKDVTSSGAVATAELFASGRYEVIAKVPKAEGLVWAVWTFHYEEHLPDKCEDFTCWCAKMPSKNVRVRDACEFRADGSGRPCKYATKGTSI